MNNQQQDYCRVYITRQRLTPGQLIQPVKNKHFRVLERAMPFVWIVQTYKPWSAAR